MGPPSVFETHEQGPACEQALLDGSMTQAEIARTLGVSEAAVSQYKSRLLTKVKDHAAKKLLERPPRPIVQDAATGMVDELAMLERNVLRLEELVAPLHDYLKASLDDLQNGAPMELLDKGLISLTRSLLSEATRSVDTLSKLKGELAPHLQAAHVQALRAQVARVNAFITERHPEWGEEYEQYLKGED